jgi:hypothetical protein
MHLGITSLVAGVTAIVCDFVSGTVVYKFWSKKGHCKGGNSKKGYDIDQLKKRVRIP